MVLFFLLFASLFSTAQAGELEYRGHIGAYDSTMPQIKRQDVTKTNAGVDAKLEIKYLFNKTLNFQFQPWFKTDGATKTPSEKFQFEPQEMALEWKKSSRKVKVGYNTVTWEGTDVVNPMDIASVKNYRDPLSIQTRGSAGIFYSDQIGNFSWDALFIPWNTKALMPGQESPWYPRNLTISQQNDQQIQLPEEVDYKIYEDTIRDRALANNGGLRLQYHGDSLDFSLAGFEGQAPNPMLIPIVRGNVIIIGGQNIFVPQNPFEIYPIYYRQRVAATALSWTLGTWILRMAAQHAQPMGQSFSIPASTTQVDLPSWSDYGVLGVEKSLEWGEQSMTVIVQGIASHQPKSESVASFSALLEKSSMVGLRFPVKENWTWTSAYFREFKANSSFFHTEVAWTLATHWRAELAADILSGSQASVIGTYDQNDRGTFRLSYVF